MTSSFSPEPEWFRTATGKPPTILDVWDGVPSLFLAPTAEGGAILWWQFDQGDDGSDYILLVHLTDAEAQVVFETRDGNPLANVRKGIHDNRFIVVRRHAPTGAERVHLFFITDQGDTEQFDAELREIVEVLSQERTLAGDDKSFDLLVEHGYKPALKRDSWSEVIDFLAASAVPA